jgi:ABC-2 type transport system ATP-binding protein
LECRGLTKRYGGQSLALDNVNLSIEAGGIVGLLGPNGSGKTTLIKLINGLLTPSSGEIRIEGLAPGKESKALVSYLPDKECLPEWMNARQLMDFFSDFYADFDRERAGEMLSRLGIDGSLRIKQMSKGTREKVQLILTMSRQARLYLLDEPIAGVDPAAREFIMRTILTNYSEDGTVLISTHLILDVEQVLDEAVFLRQGSVVLHESVDSIRERTNRSVDQLFREMFRTQAWNGGDDYAR